MFNKSIIVVIVAFLACASAFAPRASRFQNRALVRFRFLIQINSHLQPYINLHDYNSLKITKIFS